MWRGRNCIQLLQAHTGTVASLYYSAAANTLASGGKDGKINLYQAVILGATTSDGQNGGKLVHTRQLEVTAVIDLMCQPGIISSYVRSVCLANDRSKVLVTTFGGELKELSCLSVDPSSSEDDGAVAGEDAEGSIAAPTSNLGRDINGGSLVRAHYLKDLELLSKDLEVSSIYQQFIPKSAIVSSLCKVAGGFLSAGGDGTVRQWAANEGEAHKCTRITAMDSGLSLVTASTTLVACAYDGILNMNKRGSVQILTFPDMNYVAEMKPCPGDKVYDMKFSPEGNVLAISCGNNRTYFYKEVESVWSAFGELITANIVVSFDFTSDGLFVRTADKDPDDVRANYTLRYWDVSASFGKEILIAELIRSFQWNTFSCPCAWDAKGLWNGLVELEPEESTMTSLTPIASVREPLASGSTSGRQQLTAGSASDPLVSAKSAASIPQPKPPRSIRRAVPFSGIDRSQSLAIAGRRSGNVTLHRLPAYEYTPEPPAYSQVSLKLHAGRISCILFIEEGARLVTAGADDGLIQVWRVNYDAEEAELDPEDMPPKTEGEEEEAAPIDEEEEEAVTEILMYDSADDEDMIDGKELRSHLTVHKSSEDQLSAVRDWIAGVGVAVVGTGSRQGEHLLDVASGDQLHGRSDSALLPPEELELEWVYGYSGRISRASVRYNAEGHILYPAASFGVIFDKVNGKQVLSNAHHDEVTCLDVHPSANLAASCHRGAGNIFACIWHSVTGALLKRLDCGIVCGASAICFNPGNEDVLAVAVQDAHHSILVFNWKSGHLITRMIGNYKKTLCLAFSLSGLSPTPTTLDVLGNPVGGDGDHRACPRLLAGGVGHFRFIERSVGTVFSSRQGLFGAETKKSNCLCVAAVPITGNAESSETEFFIGMSDGTVGAIPKGTGRQATFTPVLLDESGVNSGSVTSIWLVKTKEPGVEEPAEFKLVIGATNGIIKVLDQEMQPVSEWNLYSGKANYGLSPMGKLRGFKSICVDRGNRKILYGTAGGEIGEIELQDGSDENQGNGGGGPVVTGHFRDKLYGLSTHPLRQECATVGDDKMLRMWDLNKHKQILSIALPDISRAVAFSPNGLLIAAGLGGTVSGVNRPIVREHAGQIAIVSYMQNDLRIVYIAEECKFDITCVTFSPDGSRLYAGSRDCGIYIFDAVNNFKHLDTVVKHTEPVRSIDLTADGTRMVTTGEGIEVIVWDTSNFESIENDISPQIFGQDWYNRESVLAIESIGCFAPFSSTTEILSVAYGKETKLVVAANDQGILSLRRAPATALFAPGKQYYGHTPGGIAKVAFTLHDTKVISIGREDRTLMQWRVRAADGSVGDAVAFAPIQSLSVAKPLAPTGNAKHQAVVAKQGKYEDSFICNGLDLRRGKIAAPDPNPIGVKIRTVVANGQLPGCTSASSGPVPKLKSAYCGTGDILICSGKVTLSLLDDHLSQKQWVPAPSANLDCQFTKENSADASNVMTALISTTIQSISAIAVSDCSKYILIGGNGENSYELNEQRELVRRGTVGIFLAATGTLVALLANDIEGGVLDVAFSRDGLCCAAVGDDPLHSVHVFAVSDPQQAGGWSEGPIIHSKTKVTRKLANLLTFIKKTATAPAAQGVDNEFDFVCAGEDLPIFFTIRGRNVHATTAVLTETVPIYPTTSLCSLAKAQCVVTGDSAGFLWLYENGVRMKQMFGFHTGPISALTGFAMPDNSPVFGVVSGSIDCVKIWDLYNMTVLSEFNITDILSKVNRAAYLATIPTLGDSRQITSILAGECTSGYVASIAVDYVFRRLLVTLSTGVVLEFARDSGSVVLVAEGGMSSVSAIAAHPTEKQTLATIGGDKLLRLWSVFPSAFQPPRVVSDLQIPHSATAVVWVNDTVIAVAIHGGDADGNSGSIVLIDVASSDSQPPLSIESENGAQMGNHIMERALKVSSKLNNVGKGPIHMLRCSLPAPGVDYGPVQLAACSEDGAVYIYEFGFSGMITFTGSIIVSPTQRYPIYGVDFSCDNRYLRTFSKTVDNTTPIDVRYFDFQAEEMKGDNKKVIAMEITKPEKMSDVLCQTWSSVSSPACAESEWTMKKGKADSIPCSFGSAPLEPSSSRSLLAVGYTDGTITVYR
jgi:WD40 repeat protein